MADNFRHIQQTAQRVAMRLVKARGPGPMPSNQDELLAMVESMLRTPKRWSVTVLPYERRCVLQWHAVLRVVAKKVQEDAAPAD